MSNMDFVQRYDVKISNAVIVNGLTQIADQDEQVIDYLKKYGKIERSLVVDDLSDELYQNLIVEYSSGSALEGLEPHLPLTYTVHSNPPIAYEVKTLSSVYTTKIGSNVTKTYLAELKELAKQSGKDYSEVLKEMMSQIGEDVEAMQPRAEGSPPIPAEPTVFIPSPLGPEQQPLISFSDISPSNNGLGATDSALLTNEKRLPSLSLSDMNPPEVQKVVVEHIVRRQDAVPQVQSPVRLRSFSGKAPRPNNETDYDTWRSHIELLQTDSSMSPLQISRKIFESLLPPAADIVKGLRPESPPSAYLQLLDSAFGTVEDGEELFARFLNTLQDLGERPSAYLHRLQLVLNLVIKRGGVAHEEVDGHLLKQFCRGCWDNALLNTLQLEQKKSSPPTFSDLLLMIRSEEDKQQAKASRMKKHMGATKQKAQLQFHGAYACVPEESHEIGLSAIEDLRKQVVSLQSQLTSFMQSKRTKGGGNKGAAGKFQSRVSGPDDAKTDMREPIKKNPANKPKPGYCFNCGEDGHIAPSCTSTANPALVAEKRKQFEEKQHRWETQNGPSPPLNE
ncbi:zinc finger CCHC domain-containing protein 18-like [Thunnus thynnus]|uniref:zinc finger CCHC domain-containing protein 18-like n=1 Tax=Thunnus thynnus TaxID=8237 RepID=UPI0035292969